MSTPEALPEFTPEPIEVVDSFQKANEDLLRDAWVASNSPSDELLLRVSDRLAVCQQLLVPLKESQFFRDTDNPLVISAGIDAMVSVSNRLKLKVLELDPEAEDIETIRNEVQALVVFCINGDESIYLTDEMRNKIEQVSLPTPEDTVESLCQIYLKLLNTYEHALMDSGKISGFLASKKPKD
jgi:hypothetical protein